MPVSPPRRAQSDLTAHRGVRACDWESTQNSMCVRACTLRAGEKGKGQLINTFPDAAF